MARIPHILHIDDDEDDRTLFARAFARSGLSGVLKGVASAEEALVVLNRTGPLAQLARPRLIILDLGLPQLDGRDLLALLRSQAALPGHPDHHPVRLGELRRHPALPRSAGGRIPGQADGHG